MVKLIERDVKIFTTEEILEEFSNVLSRDFNYSIEEIESILTKILPTLNLVEPEEKVDIVKDDPDDNKVIECALESDSAYIITYDKHLLSIKEFRGIKILKPEEMFPFLS